MFKPQKILVALISVLMVTSAVVAVEQTAEINETKNKDKIVGATVVTTYSSGVRASDLIGMEVRNSKGKELGEITDLVMDRFGQIRYAAMSRGGVLGVGDKLFAVPFCCATIQAEKDDADEHFVMFDVDEKKLDESPGFDQENWPAVGTASYWVTIDKHFEDDVKRSQQRQEKEKKADRRTNSSDKTSTSR